MRLLHIGEAQSLEFKEFDVDDIPKYAILSHRWKAEEVLFEDMQPGGSARSKAGYGKVKGFVKMAKARGFDYCWTDTCCTLQEHSR